MDKTGTFRLTSVTGAVKTVWLWNFPWDERVKEGQAVIFNVLSVKWDLFHFYPLQITKYILI